MTKRQFLNQARDAYYRIEVLQRELNQLHILSDGCGSMPFDTPRVDKSPSLKAPFIGYIDKILKKEKQIDEEIQKFLDLKEKIMKLISTINDTTLEVVLIDRYINCQSWDEVALNLGYSLPNVYKLHRKAIDLMAEPQLDS